MQITIWILKKKLIKTAKDSTEEQYSWDTTKEILHINSTYMLWLDDKLRLNNEIVAMEVPFTSYNNSTKATVLAQNLKGG